MSVFGWLKKGRDPQRIASSPLPLHFKDEIAAFEAACAMAGTIRAGDMVPALVLNAKRLYGTHSAVTTRPDGIQIVSLKVAAPDGGFFVVAQTSGPNGPRLKPGDLVAWMAGEFSETASEALRDGDKRSAWLGFVFATLKPEFDSRSGWLKSGEFSN